MSKTKTTKRELIDQINKTVSEYLDFETTMSGINSNNKAQLTKLFIEMRHALKFKRLARLLGGYDTEEGTRYYAISTSLWLGDSLKKAIRHANVHYPRNKKGVTQS